MNDFKADPIRTLSFMMNMEKRPDGLQMAKLVHDHYFVEGKPYEEQMEQMEQVIVFYWTVYPIYLLFILNYFNADYIWLRTV